MKEILEAMNDLVLKLPTRNFIILVFLGANLILYIQFAIVVSLDRSRYASLVSGITIVSSDHANVNNRNCENDSGTLACQMV